MPPERGRKARPAHDNRRFLNGMLHVLRVGCPWRDMHERYGKWTRFMCGSGAGQNKASGM
ncbi:MULTISPECIES: transposase [unclassified Sphingomonas]|uniref:transposase n=1 Tax=Sphingomonas sp. ABOLE TaxID=1985878 RepID=UPI001F49D410|nr:MULTISPECIES: transposase [Sphingomonas]